MRLSRFASTFATVAALAALALFSGAGPARGASPAGGLQKIKHLIFIVQENRSFDSYFGTYPGADGIPSPLPCLPSQFHPHRCNAPYLTHADKEQAGPYTAPYQVTDIDGGKMDGFVLAREQELGSQCAPGGNVARRAVPLRAPTDPEAVRQVASCVVDVMGHHDGTDLPNYWAYARNYVLLDHYFESISAWSLPAHLALFSGWAAACSQTDPPDVDSCRSTSTQNVIWLPGQAPPYLWTDVTYLLWQHGITWTAYLDHGLAAAGGAEPDEKGTPGVLSIWDVLPGFETVVDDGQTANAEVNQTQFFSDAAAGTLPQVSWLLPESEDSEHPPYSLKRGVAYTTGLIDAIMSGPDWSSSAIFLVWDDMGGLYDHEPPPYAFDSLGLGIRLPALLISPYAKAGYIDHRVCSSDCFLTLIEDTFLGGERMSQAGRPDPRPDYRDQEPQYADLAGDFDFKQTARPPLVLRPAPMSLLRDEPSPAGARR